MPSFVVDVCVDVVEGQKGYIASFFRDVFRLNGWEVVIGGSTMATQMSKKESLLNLANQLRASNRLKVIRKTVVDDMEAQMREQAEIKLGTLPPECDDLHILALCLIESCRNVITGDHRLGTCSGLLRRELGHERYPSVRIISTEQTYLRLKNSGAL